MQPRTHQSFLSLLNPFLSPVLTQLCAGDLQAGLMFVGVLFALWFRSVGRAMLVAAWRRRQDSRRMAAAKDKARPQEQAHRQAQQQAMKQGAQAAELRRGDEARFRAKRRLDTAESAFLNGGQRLGEEAPPAPASSDPAHFHFE